MTVMDRRLADLRDKRPGQRDWTASWLPFGGVHVTSGAPIEARFPGQWFQAESGLHQNWMRDYDPTTGRYLEPDPLGLVDGASVYGYARQNPGRWVDPRGEQGISIPGGPFPGPGPAMGVAPGTPLGDALGNSAGDALEALLDLSHNYNPIDLALQAIVAACSPEQEKACDDQYEVDVAICRQLTSPSRKRACYAQAAERLAACRTARPKPPFPYP